MRHPALFSAVACHSGDAYFELSVIPDIPKTVRTLRRHGGVEGFLRYFDATEAKRPDDITTIMMLALGACYSPDPARPLGHRAALRSRDRRDRLGGLAALEGLGSGRDGRPAHAEALRALTPAVHRRRHARRVEPGPGRAHPDAPAGGAGRAVRAPGVRRRASRRSTIATTSRCPSWRRRWGRPEPTTARDAGRAHAGSCCTAPVDDGHDRVRRSRRRRRRRCGDADAGSRAARVHVRGRAAGRIGRRASIEHVSHHRPRGLGPAARDRRRLAAPPAARLPRVRRLRRLRAAAPGLRRAAALEDRARARASPPRSRRWAACRSPTASPSPRPLGYRNRSKLVCARAPARRRGAAPGALVLGAYAPRTHDVVDLAGGCRIAEPPLDDVAVALRDVLEPRRRRPLRRADLHRRSAPRRPAGQPPRRRCWRRW